jgi:predicted enzyme related to lactoylglutathione lyase
MCPLVISVGLVVIYATTSKNRPALTKGAYMAVKSIGLIWITVKDLKSAIKFYTEVIGLKLKEQHDQYGWAELSGQDGSGASLGIAQENDMDGMSPGSNAVVTLTVQDIVKAKNEMAKKGAKMVGDILEIPGHVKLQTVEDRDGNRLQLVQTQK